MAEPISPEPVEVAGLQIPADLAPQIIAAFREIYPTVTTDKDDDAAVRAVLVWFITATLETSASRKANAALDTMISQAQAKTGAEIEKVRGQIRAAAARIKEKPVEATPDAL